MVRHACNCMPIPTTLAFSLQTESHVVLAKHRRSREWFSPGEQYVTSSEVFGEIFCPTPMESQCQVTFNRKEAHLETSPSGSSLPSPPRGVVSVTCSYIQWVTLRSCVFFRVTVSSQLQCSATEWSGEGFSRQLHKWDLCLRLVAKVFCLLYLCIITSGRILHPSFLYHLPWYDQPERSVFRYIFTTTVNA